jgi:hypothetical protein
MYGRHPQSIGKFLREPLVRGRVDPAPGARVA